MRTIGVRALKQNASAVVAEAARGELITITARGAPIAQIGPLSTTQLAALLSSGGARAPRRTFASLGAAPRRVRGEEALSVTLSAMRADGRY